jgi:hypothetical protein
VPRPAIDRALTRRDVPLREKTLWRMLDETAARVSEMLALNIDDLDLAVRAWPARPANQIPAARHAGRSWLGRERLPATSRAVGGKPESAAVPGAGQPRKLGQIGIVGTLRLVRDAELNRGAYWGIS